MANFVIIGASSGIGIQLAKQLANAGHNVTATYNKTQPTPIDGVTYYNLNVLDTDLDLSFLPPIIDGLAYCPGTIQLKPFTRISETDFIEDYKVQVLGAVKVLKIAFPLLKKSPNAAVVLFSTVAAQIGLPYHSLVASSKGAIEGLTKALSAEWAPSVRINCIAPSLTDTPLAATLLSTIEKREANALRHPLKRIGTATDIANLAQFLITDVSGWITGQVIHADGGMSTIKV